MFAVTVILAAYQVFSIFESVLGRVAKVRIIGVLPKILACFGLIISKLYRKLLGENSQ